MQPIPIHDLSDERLDVYRNLPRSKLGRESGRFVAEGRLVVRRLIHSDFAIESFLVSEHQQHAIADWLPDDVPAYVLPKPRVEELIGFKFHQGVMACGIRGLAVSLAEQLERREASLLVALPRVNDPENLGQIIRTAAAFGADLIVLGAGCADPFSRRVLRVSMGNAFFLPIVESANLLGELREVKSTKEISLIAAVLDDDALPLETVARRDRVCLIFGNEADGLDSAWLELADVKATIPMSRGVDSLNVAVSAGVFLYHFTREATRM